MPTDTSQSDATLPRRVGLVAGRGRYPILFCEAARRQGVECLGVVMMHGETEEAVADLAHRVERVYVGQIGKTIKAFRKWDIEQVVFAGQVTPGRLFGDLRPDLRAARLLWNLKTRNAESIFSAIADEFTRDGLHILPATTFLEANLAPAGTIGRVQPKSGVREDLALGWRIAREISRLDIGQTVVVKRGTVLAVEGFEGTDRAIRRGGDLGKGEVTVVKVAKPDQDMRFDVPCDGVQTVESLRAAGAVALGVQAEKTLFIDRDQVIDALDQEGIAIVGLDESLSVVQ